MNKPVPAAYLTSKLLRFGKRIAELEAIIDQIKDAIYPLKHEGETVEQTVQRIAKYIINEHLQK